MNTLYTHTVCAPAGDMSGWLLGALCALPYVLLILDYLR